MISPEESSEVVELEEGGADTPPANGADTAAADGDRSGELYGAPPTDHSGVVDWDHQRRVVLGVASLLAVFSIVSIAVFRSMQHCVSLVACCLLLKATYTTEALRSPGHPRHCYNRACALSVSFICCAFAAGLDCIALLYSMVEHAMHNENHTPDHYTLFVMVTCWVMALEVGTLGAIKQLQGKIEEESAVNPPLFEQDGNAAERGVADDDIAGSLDANNEAGTPCERGSGDDIV